MTSDLDTARDDLAFMRALVQSGDDGQKQFGETYFAAGLIYGGEMLMHAAQARGWLPGTDLPALAIGLGPTVLFLVVMGFILARHRRLRPSGVVGRAIGSAFGAAGMSNLALIAVIGAVAWREHSATTWLIYPCAVFVLQGAAWLVAALMRRRAWMGLVALGWFASAIAMAINVQAPAYYVLFAGLGLLGCMLAPGAVMMRLASRRPA